MSRKKAVSAEEAGSAEVEVTSNESGEAVANEKAERDAAAAPVREAASNHQPRQPGDEPEYPPEPNPRQWRHSNQAGVELLTRREPYQAELVFREKPSQPVIDCLKDNGFRWDRQEKVWTRPVKFDTQAQDRLIASRTYYKVVNMILEEKGLAAEPETSVHF